MISPALGRHRGARTDHFGNGLFCPWGSKNSAALLPKLCGLRYRDAVCTARFFFFIASACRFFFDFFGFSDSA